MREADWTGRLDQVWRRGMPPAGTGLLRAAALGYGTALRLRALLYAAGILHTRRLPCRVISVGNLTLGGTGKTPMVELLARELQAEGLPVVILSRGYGRARGAETRAVADGRRLLLGPEEAGDEPYLLASRLPGVPVVVGAHRYRAGAWALERFHPQVLLLDDGFQHRTLAKDLEILLVSAREPWGRGGLFPRGSLREPVTAAARADLLVLTHAEAGPEIERITVELRRLNPSAPLALARHEPEGVVEVGSGRLLPVETFRERPLLAFAGIADPDSFRATLTRAGVLLLDFLPFPDHYRYTPDDLRELEERAKAEGAAGLITTEKDAVRLPGGSRLPVWALRIRLALGEGAGPWWAALRARLAMPR